MAKKLLTLLSSVCLILVLAALTFMAACAPEEVTPTPPEKEKPTLPAEKSVLRTAWSSTPPTGMNPFGAADETDYLYLSPMYEPLCMPMVDGTVQPWIAKSWEYKADENAWIFHLDESAKWSDGEPLTADDVKHTLETAWKYNFVLASSTKAFVESIQVIDDHKVSFKMAVPCAAFVSLAGSTLIMPKHIWSKVDDVATYENPNPVGSGPFLFKEYKLRAFLYLVKDPNYWRGSANIDELIIQVYSNEEAQIMALKKGEIDCIPSMNTYSLLSSSLAADPDVEVFIERTPHTLYIAPNYRIYPLNLREVRQAISLAVDRKAIINTALAGYAELPLMGYIVPFVPKWANTKLTWEGLNMIEEERIGEANAILDGLGFKRRKDGIRQTKERKKLEFRLLLYASPPYVRAAGIIKEDLEKIGIKINISVLDPETLYGGIIFSGKRPYDWDLLLHGSSMTPDPDHFAREYAPEPPTPWQNATAFGWENEEIQSLLRQSRRELDETKRWEMIQEAQELFADQLVVITLGHKLGGAAYRTDKFTGWNPTPIFYGSMFHPLAAIQNILSLRPISK